MFTYQPVWTCVCGEGPLALPIPLEAGSRDAALQQLRAIELPAGKPVKVLCPACTLVTHLQQDDFQALDVARIETDG